MILDLGERVRLVTLRYIPVERPPGGMLGVSYVRDRYEWCLIGSAPHMQNEISHFIGLWDTLPTPYDPNISWDSWW
jgi:hypothetical protein